jgi:hypothetical protein
VALDPIVQTSIQVFSGASFLGFLGVVVNKFFASGDSRLADQRKNKDDLYAELSSRVKQLTAELESCEKKTEWQNEVRYAQSQQLQLWVFKWDALRAEILRLAKMLRDKEDVPLWMLESLERTEKASEIMSSVPPPESEKTAD